jgi:hypothetical protein
MLDRRPFSKWGPESGPQKRSYSDYTIEKEKSRLQLGKQPLDPGRRMPEKLTMGSKGIMISFRATDSDLQGRISHENL